MNPEFERLRRQVADLKAENAQLHKRLAKSVPIESSQQEARRLRTERHINEVKHAIEP